MSRFPHGGPARAAIVVLLLLVGPAAGQGLPMLPDPIDTPALLQYADVLELSDQQRLGLEPIHDAYLERFARLRDREIQEFQDELLDIATQFMRSQFDVPPREDLEHVIESFEKVLGRIQAVDRTLFTEMQSILTEEQLGAIRRPETIRQLEIYRLIAIEIAGDMNRGARPNLSDMARMLDLSATEQQAVDEILPEYEIVLLRKTKKLHDVLKDAAVVVLDTIDAMGLRDMSMQEKMALMESEETQASLMQTFDEQSEPLQSAAADLSRFNLRTARRLFEVLDDKTMRELRDRFYNNGYWEVYPGMPQWLIRYRKAAGDEEFVSAEQRREIEVQQEGFLRIDDQILDELVDVVQTSMKFRSSRVMSGDERMAQQDKIDDLQSRRQSLSERADATLDGILGPETIAALFPDTKKQVVEQGGQVIVSVGPGHTSVTHEAAAQQAEDESDRTSQAEIVKAKIAEQQPGPIMAGQVDLLSRQLRLDPEMRPILDSLFDDYRTHYDETLEAAIEGDLEPTGFEQAREQRLDRLRALDESFFDDVALLEATDEHSGTVDRFRSLRSRAVSHDLMTKAGGFGMSDQARLDLVQLVIESDDDALRTDSVNAVLDEYAAAATIAFDDRLETARSARRRMEMLEAAMQQGGSAEFNETVQGSYMDMWNRMRRAEQAIVELNETHLERILELVPEDRVWSIRYAYHREAYPDVYRSSEKIEELFTEATVLPDLTDQQQLRIMEISGEYRDRYFTISNRMIEVQRKQGERDWNDFMRREMIEGEIELERLRFRREEIGARSKMRLRLTLSDQQAEAIMGKE